MDETLITETTTQAGQKKKKATKYINPSATNEQVKGFAQLATALTTDNYDGAYVTSYRTKGEVVFQTKPTPNLSLGGWSAVDTVYVAPITYDGDGELSVNVGSISNGSLIVNDADGIFNGVLTASAGDSYASAAFGFSYDTDYVTIQGGDSDISYNDAKAQILLKGNSSCLFKPAMSHYFNHGSTIIRYKETYSKGRIYSTTGGYATVNSSTISSYTYVYDTDPIYKVNEQNGFVLIKEKTGSSSSAYVKSMYLTPFSVDPSTGAWVNTPYTSQIKGFADLMKAKGSEIFVLPALQSPYAFTAGRILSSVEGGYDYVQIYPKLFRYPDAPEDFSSLVTVSTAINTSLYNGANVINVKPNGYPLMKSRPPVINYGGEDVTITAGDEAENQPIIHVIQNKSSNQEYAFVYSGLQGDALACYTIATAKRDSVNPWIEDDGNVLLGCYYNRNKDDSYVITYKPGTYSKDTYLDDAFNIWSFLFDSSITAVPVKSPLKLSQVLDDINI